MSPIDEDDEMVHPVAHRSPRRAMPWRAILAAQLALFVHHANAETVPTPSPPPTPPPVDVSQHLLGNWRGLLDTLDASGIDPVFSYLSESSANVSGGMRTGVDYADQRAVGLNIDWEKLAGISGFQTKTLFVNRGGRAVGSDYVGDTIFNENEIQGGAGNVAVHLSYIYGIETLLGGKMVVSSGRLSEGLFFNASPIYCSFLNFALCPAARALTGGSDNSFNMAPANVWGGVIKVKPGGDYYVTVGAFEAGGRAGGRSGFSWGTNQDDGVTIPFEIGWDPKGDHPSHFKGGFYYTSANATDVLKDINGNPAILTGLPSRVRANHLGAWAAADVTLMPHGKAGGLVAFADYVHTPGNISEFSDLAFFGVEDSGLFESRPFDSFGVQFTYGHQSRELEHLQEIIAAESAAAGGPTIYAQTNEYVLEGQYDAHVFNGVDLQPDIQYVIRPNATSQYNNAVVLSLRVILEL
jgi:porin